jgi:5'-deoxynucleotidase YfbR-like HD superfamily hydrolase
MAKPTYAEVERLFSDLVLPFYYLERDMALPGKVHRNETDAEHSWSLAFIGCSLAAKVDPSLDLGLIAQLAIVHDVLEVFLW